MDDNAPPSIDKGTPLAIDPNAVSDDPELPAFLARPADAPVYYGFPILHDVVVDGFTLGMISDFLSVPNMQFGDGFVIAPDTSRAGLVWEVAPDYYFTEVLQPDDMRWGVWAVALPEYMNSPDAARRNLATMLPDLKAQWLKWQQSK